MSRVGIGRPPVRELIYFSQREQGEKKERWERAWAGRGRGDARGRGGPTRLEAPSKTPVALDATEPSAGIARALTLPLRHLISSRPHLALCRPDSIPLISQAHFVSSPTHSPRSPPPATLTSHPSEVIYC